MYCLFSDNSISLWRIVIHNSVISDCSWMNFKNKKNCKNLMPDFSKSFWDRLLNKKIVVCSLSFAYPLLWQNYIRNNQIEIRTNTHILYKIIFVIFSTDNHIGKNTQKRIYFPDTLIYVFFLKKTILIPNVAEKNIVILLEEKLNNLIESFCHTT